MSHLTPTHMSRAVSFVEDGWRSCVAIVLFLLLPSCGMLCAQTRKATEYEIKAAYLYNFGKFIRWPSSTGGADSFLICVLGANPFGSTLQETVNGESLDGKRLEVRIISDVVRADNCRIIFISSTEERRLDTTLAELGKRPVLTVSDIHDFVERGGDIGFVNQGEKIRFEVNLAAAEKSGLTLSSDLLKVAVSVKRDGRSGE